MCYPMSGTIDGQLGDHILLAPPFIIEAADVQIISDRLTRAIGDVSANRDRAA